MSGPIPPAPPAPPGPPPLRPSASPGLPPAAPPAHQKLTLYASGALVVLIVIVIILLGAGPRRAVLPFVPAGQRAVQVIDLARYLGGPVYAALAAAQHPSLRRLDAEEQELGVPFGREVLLLGEADHLQILVGRLRPGALRATFESQVQAEEKRINQGSAPPVHLAITRGELEGRPYYSCVREAPDRAFDRAFASLGSSVACFGDSQEVRGFLKTSVGLSKPILSDEELAAVYSPAAARRAFLYRLERGPGKILAQGLADALGESQTDLRAAFFALATAGKEIEATIRILVASEALAKTREEQLRKDAGQQALREILGTETPVRVGRRGAVLSLEAAIPLSRFRELAVQDKQGQARNLILALLAR